MSFAEASKLIGQKWKELSKEEKEPYEKMAQEEQQKKELEKDNTDTKEKEKKVKEKVKEKVKKTPKKVSKKASTGGQEGSLHPGVASKSPRPMHTFLPVQEIDVGKPAKTPKSKEGTKKRTGTPYGIFMEKREKQLRAEYCERHPNATEAEIKSFLTKTFESLPSHERETYVEEAKKVSKTTKKVNKRKKSTDDKDEKPNKKQKTEPKIKKSSTAAELPHVPLPILPATPLSAPPISTTPPLSTSQEKKRILFKRIEDPGFSQVFLQNHTKDELSSKITEKLQESRKIVNIIYKSNGEDLIINDDEDVQTLDKNAKLEVHFA